MSWAEIKKAVNRGIDPPLDVLLYERTLLQHDSSDSVDWAFLRLDMIGETGNALADIMLGNFPQVRTCKTLADLFASLGAVGDIASNAAAMAAITMSNIAVPMATASADVMNILFSAPTARSYILGSTTVMNAVLASSVAFNTLLSSAVYMDAAAESSTAMNVIVKSATALSSIASSSIAMTSLYDKGGTTGAVQTALFGSPFKKTAARTITVSSQSFPVSGGSIYIAVSFTGVLGGDTNYFTLGTGNPTKPSGTKRSLGNTTFYCVFSAPSVAAVYSHNVSSAVTLTYIPVQ